MTVTEIIPLDKKRNRIFIDSEFAFVIYKGECHIYGVEKDVELSEENYNKIVNEVLPKRAKLRAINLLSKKDYTEYGLRKKLDEGFYNEEIIDKTIEYLKSYGYIDDKRYVKNYFASYIQSRPRNKIIQKLVEKGISHELLEDMVEAIYEEERELTYLPDEIELGRKLLEKKKYNNGILLKDRQKVYGYLMRNGITAENALKLLKEYQKEDSST